MAALTYRVQTGGQQFSKIRLKSSCFIDSMLKLGLDIGTGFVKCVSNYGSIRFPSIYVKRIHGHWTQKTTEAVGDRARDILKTVGTSAISPIQRGKPDARYQKQVEMLLEESIHQITKLVKAPTKTDNDKIRIVVGLPYHAFDYQDTMVKTIKKVLSPEKCIAVAQASGTLVDLNQDSGIVVSIGQGTTEIVVIDNLEVIDGESSRWASSFVTRKIDKFAHLDIETLNQNHGICTKYSKVMAEHLIREIQDISALHGDRYPIALSGGGILLAGMKDELVRGLKKFKVLIPDDPVMSNARGLYQLVEES